MLKCALIGCGGMGQGHLGNLSKLSDNTELYSSADITTLPN